MARSADDPRLCFKALYHDELSGLSKEFQLKFYLSDRTIELTDLGTRRIYLKRTETKSLEASHFVLGKSVVVFGRLLHLTEYMDTVTAQLCEGVAGREKSASDHVLAAPVSDDAVATSNGSLFFNKEVAPPCGTCYVFVERSKFFKSLGKVFSVLDVELGFTVTGITAGTLPASAVAHFNSTLSVGQKHKAGYITDSVNSLTGKMVCCFRLAKANCAGLVPEIYERLVPRAVMGRGKRDDDASLPNTATCGLFAMATPNSDTVVVDNTATMFSSLFEAIQSRAARKHLNGPAARAGTIVIIKPHILIRKLAGDVLTVLLEESGGEVEGLSLINLTSRDAASMLAPYRGVLPEFHGTMSHLSSGASIAIHLCSPATASSSASEDAYRDKHGTDMSESASLSGGGASGGASYHSPSSPFSNSSPGEDEDVFHTVRALCGPYDPTIAKSIRSSTIRARYGVDRSMNAVHCCDLLEEVAGVSRFVFCDVATRRVLKPSTEAT